MPVLEILAGCWTRLIGLTHVAVVAGRSYRRKSLVFVIQEHWQACSPRLTGWQVRGESDPRC